MSSYKFKWEPIPNTVRTRMVEDSLLHTLKRNSRITRQKKLLNMRIRTGEKIRSYNHYLKLKQKIMEQCPDSSMETDNDTSDDNICNRPNYKRSEKIHYLLTPCQKILKHKTQSLTKKRKLSDCQEYNDTDDDSDGYYESKISRSKKNARLSKETCEIVSSLKDQTDVEPTVKQEKDENENDSTTMNDIETYSAFENNDAEINKEHLRIQISKVQTLKLENTSISDNLESNHECITSNEILPTSAFQKKNISLIQTALYNLGSNCETDKMIQKESWHKSRHCDDAIGKENLENGNKTAASSNEHVSKKNNESDEIIIPNLADEDTSGSRNKKTSQLNSNKRVTNEKLYDSERQNLTRHEFLSSENGDGTQPISEDGDKVSSSTSAASPRVSNLADYIFTQELKLDMRKGSIKLKHISPDDEIWIMEVPKKMNPEDLLQQTLVLDGKTRLEVQDTCYKISAKRNKKDIHLSCMFNTGKRKKRFKTVNFKPEGFIKFRQKMSGTCEPESVPSPTTRIQFPTNLKMSHPLLEWLGPLFRNGSEGLARQLYESFREVMGPIELDECLRELNGL